MDEVAEFGFRAGPKRAEYGGILPCPDYLSRPAHGGSLQPSHLGSCEGERYSACGLCAGERKHDLAEEFLAKTTIKQDLFLILAGRAQAPVWDVGRNRYPARKKPMPYINHYSFHVLDPKWGHITIKIGHAAPMPSLQALDLHDLSVFCTRSSSPWQKSVTSRDKSDT